jgi:hypothetical protein
MARKSATREVEAEIFALLKFNTDQIAEARDSIEYERSNAFGDGNSSIPVAKQASTIAEFKMGSNIQNVEGPIVDAPLRGKLN